MNFFYLVFIFFNAMVFSSNGMESNTEKLVENLGALNKGLGNLKTALANIGKPPTKKPGKADLLAELKARRKLKTKEEQDPLAPKKEEKVAADILLEEKGKLKTGSEQHKLATKAPKAKTPLDLLAENFPELHKVLSEIRSSYQLINRFNVFKERRLRKDSLSADDSKEEEALRVELMKGVWINTLKDLLPSVIFTNAEGLTGIENNNVKKYVIRQIKELEDNVNNTQLKIYILDKFVSAKPEKQKEIEALKLLIAGKLKELRN